MAIEASELRIGNIMQDAKSRYCRVEQLSINIEDVKIYAIKGAITTSPISPVILTEEILLKCGFKFNGYRSYYVLIFDSLFLELLKRNNGSFQPRNCTSDTGIEIKYLHQLQNLYFALTGKELNVNL